MIVVFIIFFNCFVFVISGIIFVLMFLENNSLINGFVCVFIKYLSLIFEILYFIFFGGVIVGIFICVMFFNVKILYVVCIKFCCFIKVLNFL